MRQARYISGGYALLHQPEHPLASADGLISEHRAVLYERIGPGTHPCHWCGTMVVWARRKVGARSLQRLFVDHVDRDKLNNASSNLVPSCCACNATRSSGHRVAKRVLRREMWRKERFGHSWYQLTLECGHAVVRRRHNSQRAWCAVCVGQEEPDHPDRRVGLGGAVAIERASVPDGGYMSAALIGPIRKVLKEESGTRPDGSGYVYRYHLVCGHNVERRSPGRTRCACPECVTSAKPAC